jgi:hypothetical protein
LFIKGTKKIPGSGRKKGSKNKKTIARVADKLADKSLDPTEEILKIIPTLEPKDQVNAWLDLLSYTQPKPKEIEVPEEIADEDFFGELRDVSEAKLIEIATRKEKPM